MSTLREVCLLMAPNMLQTMNARNLLQKVRTDNIMMTPNQTSQVKLNELNDIIREQSGERQ